MWVSRAVQICCKARGVCEKDGFVDAYQWGPIDSSNSDMTPGLQYLDTILFTDMGPCSGDKITNPDPWDFVLA